MNRSVTRAALVTPAGRGAVASVVVGGPQAVAVVDSLFRSAVGRTLTEQPPDRILYGSWKSTHEDVIVARRSALRVEVHCHGGVAASTAILGALAEAGCQIVSWQELVRSEMASATRAEALIALAECSTERTAAILLDQYHGALDAAIEQSIREFQSQCVAGAVTRLRELLGWAAIGKHLTKPWRVVIGGPANVGKSTLINALVGYERAIVFDQPGTTRDVVTAETAIDGWPIELADTAGLRATLEPLERAGVLRARAAISQADLVMLVLDITRPWTSELEQLVADWPAALVVHNKSDLIDSQEVAEVLAERPAGVLVSAKSGQHVPNVLAAIVQRIVPTVPPSGSAVPFADGQVCAIQSAIALAEAGQSERAAAVLARLVSAVEGE